MAPKQAGQGAAKSLQPDGEDTDCVAVGRDSSPSDNEKGKKPAETVETNGDTRAGSKTWKSLLECDSLLNSGGSSELGSTSDSEPAPAAASKAGGKARRATDAGNEVGGALGSESETKSESLYIVAAVLDFKAERGKGLYRVRWLGFPPGSDTFEPKENIFNPDARIRRQMTEAKARYEAKQIMKTQRRENETEGKEKEGERERKRARDGGREREWERVRERERESEREKAKRTKRRSSRNTEEKEEDSDDEEFYKIAALVDYKIEGGRELWRVRWSGYAPSADTYEPRENIMNPDSRLRRQMENLKAAYEEREEIKYALKTTPMRSRRTSQVSGSTSPAYIPRAPVLKSKASGPRPKAPAPKASASRAPAPTSPAPKPRIACAKLGGRLGQRRLRFDQSHLPSTPSSQRGVFRRESSRESSRERSEESLTDSQSEVAGSWPSESNYNHQH